MFKNKLVNAKGMLVKAHKLHYAVGQFNINNLEWVSAILDKAQEINVPVILGVSEGAKKYMGGWHTIVGMVEGYMRDKNITVNVVLHLDHGSSFNVCKEAIDAGFTSVMIDASKYDLDENIKIVKQVVAYAHLRNVSVEAELGHIGGSSEESVANYGVSYADPNECVKFVKETNVDFLAPALGSVHGPYHGEPKLEFFKMSEINKLVNVPLVLHGGSNIPSNQIKIAIERGTAKINVNTECQQAWAQLVHEFIDKNKEIYDPRKIIGFGKKGISDIVFKKCEIFGCIDKN